MPALGALGPTGASNTAMATFRETEDRPTPHTSTTEYDIRIRSPDTVHCCPRPTRTQTHGCGVGLLATSICEEPWEIEWAIEISESSDDVAKRRADPKISKSISHPRHHEVQHSAAEEHGGALTTVLSLPT